MSFHQGVRVAVFMMIWVFVASYLSRLIVGDALSLEVRQYMAFLVLAFFGTLSFVLVEALSVRERSENPPANQKLWRYGAGGGLSGFALGYAATRLKPSLGSLVEVVVFGAMVGLLLGLVIGIGITRRSRLARG